MINQKPGFLGLGMVRALRLRTLRVGDRTSNRNRVSLSPTPTPVELGIIKKSLKS
ncbi:hypothetical protein PL10110_240016 [Planktothrix agardhii]|uniref:hypothetical protein n=1 Tax=Planktothrix agardhii TaxID=1160 RepID=UPI001B9AB435|nr:hypothetical protein [Planktothrix agardhii]CAD0225278.1 hypothetical protein PL10110_240016 [Planktothrix agardhii]